MEQEERREDITLGTCAKNSKNQNARFATDRAAHVRAVSNGSLDIAEGYPRLSNSTVEER